MKRLLKFLTLSTLCFLLSTFSFSCLRHDPYTRLFIPPPETNREREGQGLQPYYYRSNNPGEALVAALFYLPEWKEEVACHGRVQDEAGNPVPRTLVVFKRKDWNGAWMVSVLEPTPEGNFSFTIEPRCKHWEISVLGENIAGVRRTLGGSARCPSFDFVVNVLSDPEEMKAYRKRWQKPYIKSLLALGAGVMSEAEEKILVGLLNR